MARRELPFIHLSLNSGGRRKSGKWDKLPYWVPINLDWMLDEYERMAHGKPTWERDLVPNKPYISNLGRVVKTAPNYFALAYNLAPTGQKVNYSPGKYCFEITAFGEQIEPTKRYFYVDWSGGYDDDPRIMEARLKILARDSPPW